MNEYLVTFLYELANFAVFAILLAWIFVKPIRRMLDKQSAKDKQLSESAKQHLADADQLRQQLQEDRQRFSHEMEQQRKSLLQESQQQAAELLANAKRQIEKQREQLQTETLQYQQSQVSEIADTVADVSGQAVAMLLQQINGPSLENAFVDSACRELQKTDLNSSSKISVESAEELSDSIRQQIASATGRNSTNGQLEFRVNPELAGGLRIKTEHGMIDYSIAALAEFAGRSFRQRVNQQT